MEPPAFRGRSGLRGGSTCPSHGVALAMSEDERGGRLHSYYASSSSQLVAPARCTVLRPCMRGLRYSVADATLEDRGWLCHILRHASAAALSVAVSCLVCSVGRPWPFQHQSSVVRLVSYTISAQCPVVVG
eukprot:scaffold11655_cov121-Isochrysis_galbana.AAC.6